MMNANLNPHTHTHAMTMHQMMPTQSQFIGFPQFQQTTVVTTSFSTNLGPTTSALTAPHVPPVPPPVVPQPGGSPQDMVQYVGQMNAFAEQMHQFAQHMTGLAQQMNTAINPMQHHHHHHQHHQFQPHPQFNGFNVNTINMNLQQTQTQMIDHRPSTNDNAGRLHHNELQSQSQGPRAVPVIDLTNDDEMNSEDDHDAETCFVPWSDSDIPHEFKCPISLEIMTDPVKCSDGFYYERQCIENWLSQHPRSPMTNLVLERPSLRRDLNLADSIKRWMDNRWQIFQENELQNERQIDQYHEERDDDEDFDQETDTEDEELSEEESESEGEERYSSAMEEDEMYYSSLRVDLEEE